MGRALNLEPPRRHGEDPARTEPCVVVHGLDIGTVQESLHTSPRAGRTRPGPVPGPGDSESPYRASQGPSRGPCPRRRRGRFGAIPERSTRRHNEPILRKAPETLGGIDHRRAPGVHGVGPPLRPRPSVPFGRTTVRTPRRARAASAAARAGGPLGRTEGARRGVVNRLVFCMFADDVGLLPDHMFTRMLRHALPAPARFGELAGELFRAMASGGRVGFEMVAWFNGSLFNDATTLPLERTDIETVLAASDLDWSEIDPSRRRAGWWRTTRPARPQNAGPWRGTSEQSRNFRYRNPLGASPGLVDGPTTSAASISGKARWKPSASASSCTREGGPADWLRQGGPGLGSLRRTPSGVVRTGGRCRRRPSADGSSRRGATSRG